MKYLGSMLMVAVAIWAIGCASIPKVAVVEPVGPEPGEGPATERMGSLVVYSARALELVDVNQETWRLNNDSGINQPAAESAHSDYKVYTKTGALLRHIRNSSGSSDDSPTLVSLPAGSYRVEAQGLNCDGSRVAVDVPVVVKGGQATIAHLEGGWRPLGYPDTEVAKLPCGRVIGWRASGADVAAH